MALEDIKGGIKTTINSTYQQLTNLNATTYPVLFVRQAARSFHGEFNELIKTVNNHKKPLVYST